MSITQEIEINDEYNLDDNSETISEGNTTESIIISAPPTLEETNNAIFIKTKFGAKTQPVQFTIIATGQTGNTSITGGKLRLIYGRIYFLPIDAAPEINSDNFANLKMFSDLADKIDVRFINNQFAAIIPLQNNIMLSDDTRLCVLW